MSHFHRKRLLIIATFACVLSFTIALANDPSYRQWVPVIFGPSPEPQYLINAPYFPVSSVTNERFEQMAIFWFGQLSRSTNYTDVRVGYNDNALFLYLASFDRQLWYDTTPSATDLIAWDAATLLIDTANGTQLSAASFRFVAQLRNGNTPDPAYQLSQRGTGGSWTTTAVAFSSIPGWRGDRLNDNNDSEDRGWAMTFQIPFTSLGLSGQPPDGTRWRMALILHDRDDATGSSIPNQVWPPALNASQPSTWGGIRFGLPVYTPPSVSAKQTFQIRHGLNGVTVVDAGIGGVNPYMCDDSGNYWDTWPNRPRPADQADISIQNQADIADWPCFAKYYITFPLTSLPPGRTVISATLVLSQMGNAEPAQAQRSLIQALLVGEDWSPATLTWNNAPLVRENIGFGWVDPISGFPGDWTRLPKRTIDVTRGVVQAYTSGQPLRLALYSADSAYHSGKYFVSNGTGDWNAANRPTLIVVLSQ